MNKSFIVAAFFLAVLISSQHCRGDNQVFSLLMGHGVTIGADEVVRLPDPTLPDGLSAEDQRKSVEAIKGNIHTWDELTRKSVVAPFVVRISNDAGRPHGSCRRIDLWFVAYGNLKTLANDEFLKKQFKSAASESDPENGSSSKQLTEADLARRGLKAPQRPGDPEFTASQFSLLDRVRLFVTTRATVTETKDSLLSASVLDPKFADDAAYPNQWRLITRNDEGRRTIGSPQPYAGYAGYAKATRLIEPAGAIFIEYHAAFAEPTDWFNGTSLLRSKLPLVAQYIVRQLRRGLEKAN